MYIIWYLEKSTNSSSQSLTSFMCTVYCMDLIIFNFNLQIIKMNMKLPVFYFTNNSKKKTIKKSN